MMVHSRGESTEQSLLVSGYFKFNQFPNLIYSLKESNESEVGPKQNSRFLSIGRLRLI